MLENLEEFKQKLKIWKIKFDIWLYKVGLKPMSMELLQEMAELGEEMRVTASEFYDVYIAEDIASDEIIKRYEYLLYERTFISKSGESLTKISKSFTLPSKNELRYMGFKDEVDYFKRVTVYMVIVFVGIFIFTVLRESIFEALFNAVILTVLTFFGSLIYPKIRLMLFKGEIKLQVLFALLYMVSLLRVGSSLPEVLDNLAKSNEYGIVSFEVRSIIKDVNSGYSLTEALERAKLRTKIPLLKKVYEQMIIGYAKGNPQLLLEKLYEDIVRESLARLDASKFMIQNLGNLIFGTGVILPFSGMMLSSMMGNQGFPGILNAVDLVLTKIGPALALIFGIFVKLKVE